MSAMTQHASIRPLVAGNWKMNGLRASLQDLAAMAAAYDEPLAMKVELLICPPFPLLSAAVAVAGSIAIGAQDCAVKASGAHTGDVAAEMLADAGARFVIVGHSERRADHGETDAIVQAKVQAALRAGLTAIVCVGETQAERAAGQALDVVKRQLQGSIPHGATATQLVVAYEPVWAIGTGLVPTVADVEQVHALMRVELSQILPGEGDKMRLLYGGSVKPANAAELMGVPHVNGALVGGASLKATDFFGIVAAYR